MKTLTKIFMTVVALVAVSCATDLTTDDLRIPGGGVGQTELTISLEETKTQLGAETSGIYSLLWSAGDNISVNGVASQPLADEYDGAATAKFVVPTTAETYNIAYPAAGEGEVLFAEEQVHTTGNIANNAATMYAHCNAGEPTHLKHLTAILKIGLTGEATLTHAQISTIDRAPIAGAFNIDFESGEVTPTDASKSVIDYSFGGGLELSDEAQYIHVAVPAGTYDELYVTLYDNAHGVMYATVKAGSTNPLKVGKLRTFTNDVNYAATDKVFVIKEFVDLEDFAAVASETTMDVALFNDIEVTEAWTPIEGYSGTFMGNGYAIKGLTAPLFGTTSASFKGLHLEGVDINETVNPNVGAFARKVVATDTVKPIIEHCSASGTLVVKCEGEHKAEVGSMAGYAIGGLVGHIKGVDVKNCVNNVDIDVDQVVATTNTTILYPSVAGIVGVVDVHTITTDESQFIYSNLGSLVNNGAIDVHEVSYVTESAAVSYKSPIVPYVAGVAARFVSDNLYSEEIKDITNNGTIHLQGFYGEGQTDDNTDKGAADKDDVNYNDIDPCLGGVFGYISAQKCSNVHNYGAVTFENGHSRFHYIGGVVGMVGKFSAMDNLHNHAAVTLKSTAYIASLHCAGVVAHTLVTSSLTNSSNEGVISAKSTTVTGAAGHRFHRIAGVVAFADGSVENCNNLKSGKLDCGGTINNANNWRDVCFGGVVAYKESDPIKGCTNFADLNLGVNIAKPTESDPDGGGLTDESKRFSAGGVVGLTAQPCDNVTNRGKLTIFGKAHSWYVGGCVGDMNYGGDTTVGGYHNYGVINFKDHASGYDTNDYIVYVGGCIGYAKGAVHNATNYNSATIQIDAATFLSTCYIGGVIGCVGSATGYAKSATNNAPINIVGTTFSGYSYIGGVVGHVANVAAKADYLTNEGVITFDKAIHTVGCSHIGGAIGAIKGAVSNITNKGNISISGDSEKLTDENYNTFPNAIFFGGCVGRAQDSTNATITTATNDGSITIENVKVAAGAFRVGGIVSHSEASLNDATNNGNITIGNEGVVSLGAGTGYYVAGVVGQQDAIKVDEVAQTYEVSSLTNTGDISIGDGGTMTITGASGGIYIGGIVAHQNGALTVCTKISEATNNGDITVGDGMTLPAKNVRWGGIIGQCGSNLSDVKNTGDLTIGTKSDNPLTFSYYAIIGGAIGEFLSGTFTADKVVNEGDLDINVKYTTTDNYQCCSYGGVIGLANRTLTFTNSHNTGNITIGEKYDNQKTHMSVGGFCAVLNGTVSLTNCYNSGTIKVEAGAKITKDQHVGGLAGFCNKQPTINATNGFRNVGNIEVYNHATVTGKNYVGGIGGNVNKLIQNAQVFCDVVAPGATQVGMVIAQSRSSQLAQNCKLGGRIAKALNEDGTPKFKTVWSDVKVNAGLGGGFGIDENYVPFWEVIYGGTWADASVSNCDGCSYISGITIE